MKVLAICHTCRHKHTIDFDPRRGAGVGFSDWETKHPPPHLIEYDWPGRTGKAIQPESGHLNYLHNADVKVAYAATSDMTITLASLATDSNLLTGREATAVSNASNKYATYSLAALITTGTTPTVNKSIELWVVGAFGDAPTWPDVFDGTDSAETVTSRNILSLCARLHSVATISATSNIGYPFAPASLAGFFGGFMPVQFTCFVTHDTAVNLNSTAGNHYIRLTPGYFTVT